MGEFLAKKKKNNSQSTQGHTGRQGRGGKWETDMRGGGGT